MDDGASARSHRAFVAGLSRAGIAVEVLTGPALTLVPEVDIAAWVAARARVIEETAIFPPPDAPPPPWPHPPAHLRLDVGGVVVHLLRGPSVLPHEPDLAEVSAFLAILDHLIDRDRPDALLAHGADLLTAEALARGRKRGIPTALRLRDRGPHGLHALAADTLIAPSQALADELYEATGRPCSALPNFFEPARFRAGSGDHRYLAYFDPSPTSGLPAFARIADELGRRRPDIPLLVVAEPQAKHALDGCGLDLRRRGNLDLMRAPVDPRVAWARVRVALAPAFDAPGPPDSAVAALLNGLPVVASDRGALPELLGDSGVLLPLPDRLTAATTLMPSPEEVAPWVEAIIRLWDDPIHYEDRCRRAAVEARRIEPDALAERYARSFRDPRPPAAAVPIPAGRLKSIVLVPHLNGIEPECEEGLRGLERAGVRVLRRRGSSQIDVARNELASDALHDGFESLLFIDADIGFDPLDALRLLARPEPVASGLYAKKGHRDLASSFSTGVEEIIFGPQSPGLYPLRYAATGFLRIRAAVLRRMIAELDLPLCNLDWGRGSWPFFLPAVVTHPSGNPHYLGEDWAFSHRLHQLGIAPMADASIRLWHHGSYPYGWEDAGADRPRHPNFRFRP